MEDWIKPGEDFNPPVTISFDDAANDGRPGEADYVTGVEKVHSQVGDRKTARRLGGKTIATGKGSRPNAGALKVKARIKPAAKRRLGRLRRGRATLEVTVVDGGRTQRFAKAVKLKR